MRDRRDLKTIGQGEKFSNIVQQHGVSVVHRADTLGTQVRSAVPGRYRLWVPGLYRFDVLKRELENSLDDASAGRRASANVVTGTVLILAPRHTSVEALCQEVDSVLARFAEEQSLSLRDLDQRGRERPLHLALESRSKPLRLPELISRLAQPGSKRAERQARSDSELESQPTPTQPWHTMEIQAVRELLQGHVSDGLSCDEASQRLVRYGDNLLTKAQSRSGLRIFVDQFLEVPVALLGASAVLSALTGGVADAVAILGVVVINGVIGFVTESTAERTIAGMTQESDLQARVLRDGERLEIDAADVVPGDLLMLRVGDVVAADARLILSEHLSVDESALTGESLPASKQAEALEDARLPLGDRKNMVYRGTLVTGGSGLALVIATGRATEVGQLQHLVDEVVRPETPMQRQLRHLGHRTIVLAGAVCGGVFVIGLARGLPLRTMLRTAVSLAVAAVPEGLPTVAITTLAIGIRSMRKHQVVVRRLDAIETLGSVQILCFDKTGTITQNLMEVTALVSGLDSFTVRQGKVYAGEEAIDDARRSELELLLRVGALCSEVELEQDEDDDSPRTHGSETESALVRLALDLGTEVSELRAQLPIVRVKHRTEKQKLMATLHQREEEPKFVTMVKGAPLEVLERCRSIRIGSELRPLESKDRKEIRRYNERMAGQALRVLGMAYAESDTAPRSLTARKLTWLGMVGMADPPRDGLPELFEQFRKAGVRSAMITGDQSATAYAIAKQIGLTTDGEIETLDSTTLDQLEPRVLADLAQRVQVFSRVSPAHKLRVVQALQRAGYVVAMTGDGINDGPALKAADIGVAMGSGGTQVARDVSDVILERDDLEAMLEAIQQGRVIYDDIKKAVRFILATNMSEILLTLGSVAAGLGEGLSPMQLLWINLVSDIFPELALAMQPAEREVMNRPPRDPNAKMFTPSEFREMTLEGAFLTAGAFGAYGYGIARYGLGARARTLAFITLTVSQLLHAFSVRSDHHTIFDYEKVPKNPYIPASVGGGVVLTLLMQLLPPVRRSMGSGRLSRGDWAVTAAGTLMPMLANATIKSARLSRSTPEQQDS